MDVSARLAEAGDLLLLVTLARQGRHELNAAKGASEWLAREALPEPLEDTYGTLLGSPDAAIVMGLIDGVGVGLLALQVTAGARGRVGDVSEIYVQPEARGVGVGEAMLSLALEWCRSFDLAGIGGRALPGDRETKGLFERHRMVARSIEVYRSLEPDSEETQS